MNIISKAIISIRSRGFWETMKVFLKDYRYYLKRLIYGNKIDSYQKDSFDDSNGVETSSMVEIDDLGVKSNKWIYSSIYQATSIEIFNNIFQAIDSLSLCFSNFTFIDVGAGKGRGLMLASKYQFKNIIGIEFSPILAEIGRDNINKYMINNDLTLHIEVVLIDATEYILPKEQLFIFLFNPFKKPVMKKFVSNLVHSYNESPRRMIIAYQNPVIADAFEKIPFLNCIYHCNDFLIYDTEYSGL
ncbi:MAG: class I SAM-dependent methyltransferase [Prolixibacteraceae bacterium]|jgi:hypothetical protein|nr:class I SAM-dependent methyltransferase [Prolixibacteraceae bacterium]